MRVKSNFAERPEEVEVIVTGGRATVCFRTDIESHIVTDGNGERTEWSAVEHIAHVNALGFEPTEAFREKILAIEYADAAAEIRRRRDALLAASDSQMALDRLGLSVPSGTTFTAWLSFLRGLGDVLGGSIARYRQALRDIPQQAGFPFDVEWPEI